MRSSVFFVLMASSLVTPAMAQSVPVSAPSTTTPAEPVGQRTVIEQPLEDNILRAGTEIPLMTREELTTKKKKLRVGQRFQLEVSTNVSKNGVVVVPVGTPAIGEITEVRNKGMWGKSGYINARLVSMRIGDRNVRLSGTFDDKGITGTGGVVAAVALVPIAGFFMTGTSASIPSGSGLKGFLDEDLTFRAVPLTPQTLEVPVAGTPSPVPAASETVSPVSSPGLVPPSN